MFAKGRMPGTGYKSDVLALLPDAECRRKIVQGLTGFIVRNSATGEFLASAGSSASAWERTWFRLQLEKPSTEKSTPEQQKGQNEQ